MQSLYEAARPGEVRERNPQGCSDIQGTCAWKCSSGKSGQVDLNEYLLFHGCPKGHIESIARSRFDPQLSGTAVGAMFGHGTYFAENASKSDFYTTCDLCEADASCVQCNHAHGMRQMIVLGVGVLSIPYAFRLSGYVSILLILVTILVTAQTGVFIGSALQLASRSPQAASVPPRGRDFTFLAYVGFGGRGAALIAFVTSVEVWFALVTFMVMNGVNVSVVFPEVGAGVASVTSCVLAVVMVFIPMRVYSYLSVVASLALAVAAVALVAAAFTMREWANPYDHLGLDALLQLQNIPRSVGIIVFCFAGHPCFPVVYECMKALRRNLLIQEPRPNLFPRLCLLRRSRRVWLPGLRRGPGGVRHEKPRLAPVARLESSIC
eukprot:s743_g7.t1